MSDEYFSWESNHFCAVEKTVRTSSVKTVFTSLMSLEGSIVKIVTIKRSLGALEVLKEYNFYIIAPGPDKNLLLAHNT